MEADVVVIGGGMAGAVAALKAASDGADVLLLRKGHGASAMSSGTIDIAGPEMFVPGDPWDSAPTIPDRLREILRMNPLHPYSVIAGGREGLDHLLSRLREACDFVFANIPRLRFTGSCDRNIPLPTTVGTMKFCAFAPESLIGGNMSEMHEVRLTLVGISGLLVFQPNACKQALGKTSSHHSPSAITRIDSVEAHIPQRMTALPAAPFEVAQYLDDTANAEEFAKELAPLIPGEATHVGFPPVLGLMRHPETYEIVSHTLQKQVFELISPTFSVPGYRLQLALDMALRSKSIRMVNADVVQAEYDGRKVQNLVLGNGRSARTARGKSYVVATGKFGAGGLVAGDSPMEPIFGLPLFAQGKRVDNKFVQDLLKYDVDEKQLFLFCGIHADPSMRPLDAPGDPIYENLFAAGSLLGEYDYVTEKCGMGIALLTGYLAGQKAAS